MKPQPNMTRVIERKRYSVATSTVLAHDEYWDGSNWERRGRNTFLYRTPRGAFFAVHVTQWQGEQDEIEPLSQSAAIDLWETLREKELDFPQDFGFQPEEA